MLTENQKLWVKELREGGHKQAKGSLQNSEGYCCLGVACLAYEKATGKKVYRGGLNNFLTGGGLDNYCEVIEWLSLRSPLGCSLDDNIPALSTLNDNHGKSFAEIADLIETKPENIFYL
jgi:hypothetical protein